MELDQDDTYIKFNKPKRKKKLKSLVEVEPSLQVSVSQVWHCAT